MFYTYQPLSAQEVVKVLTSAKVCRVACVATYVRKAMLKIDTLRARVVTAVHKFTVL